VIIRPSNRASLIYGASPYFFDQYRIFFSYALFVLAGANLLEVGYMIKFILIIIGLFIIIYHPFLILVAGAIWLTWLFLSRPDSFGMLSKQRGERDNEPEPDLSHDEGFTTYEERAEKEMSHIKFKEGFQDDPMWQAQAKKVRDQIQKARDLEDAAMRAEAQNIKNWA
jgi:hypothetical protein